MMLKSKPTGKRSPRQIERDLITYREDLQKAEAEADTAKQATALNNLGTIYIDKKNCQKALTHFEQAMNLLENSPTADSISVYGNAASAARGVEDWDKAFRYALMAETLGIHHDVKGDLEIMQIAVALVRKAVGAEGFPELLRSAQESLPEHLRPLVRTEIHLAPIEQTQQKTEKQPGRNDPCPCGSGKKYKKCCDS